MSNHSNAPPAQPIAAAFAAQQQAFAQQQAQQQALERSQALELQARLAYALENPHQYPGLNLSKVKAQLLAAQQPQQHPLNGPPTAAGRPPSVPPPNGLLLQQQQQQLQAYEAEMRMKQAAANIIAASQGMSGRLNLQGLNG
eukprot:scaffold139872_cov13-Tisochrysis_lutea.AAC.1